MKSTGMVRAVDSLGRIVIPKSIRREFDVMENRDSFEIFVEDGKIILKKYAPFCIFCDNDEGITNFKGKNICKNCMKEMAN